MGGSKKRHWRGTMARTARKTSTRKTTTASGKKKAQSNVTAKPSGKHKEKAIAALLQEGRTFDPPVEFRSRAVVKTRKLYNQAQKDRLGYWEDHARELHWFTPWKKTLQWKSPSAKWFAGGKTNMSYNCLDRNIENGLRTKAALIWEGEPGETRTFTYWELYRQVNRFANVLK